MHHATTTEDRRQGERVPVELSLTWIRDGERIETTTTDISVNGLFLQTGQAVPPWTTLDLVVRMPDARDPPVHMRTLASSVGQTGKSHGVGVRIIEMSEPDRRRWDELCISLPSAAPRAPTAQQARILGVGGALSSGLCNLLREDDECVVTTCRDNAGALALARTLAPAVVLCDLVCPGMDGLTLCRELKRDRPPGSVGVILMVGGHRASDFVLGLRAGADYVIVTPYNDMLVLSRILQLTRNRADAEETEADDEPPRPRSPKPSGRSGMTISRLPFPSALPPPVARAVDKASDLWFLAKLRLKEQLR